MHPSRNSVYVPTMNYCHFFIENCVPTMNYSRFFCCKMPLRAAPGCSPGCSWLSQSAAPTASDADFAITHLK